MKRFARLTRLARRPLIVGGLVFSLLLVSAFRPDESFEVKKNIDIFAKVMREVMMNYVDEVEPNQFARFGLDAMLKTLDPYTDYISASEIDDYRFMSTGQYGGIGARVTQRDKRIVITELFKGSPADKAGLRAGDEILQIDNQLLADKPFDTEQVSNLLKGQPKSPVRLKLKREIADAPEGKIIELTLAREDIRVPNVEYAGLVQSPSGPVAYIVLTGFTKDASGEVRKALEQLKTKAAMPQVGVRLEGAKALRGIILDLRNNPGGLLDEAINISNLFVNKGEKIVETKGRMEGNKLYEAPNSPFDLETPLVVLVNQRSASASEIVAGVVQDLDRGVIVGRRSFGKGLVQVVRPLSYEAQMKITTARYYTPSGRCIQAIDYTHVDAEGGVVKRADSLKKEFTTRRGRKVLDSGGIEPEVKVDELELHKISADLRNQFVIFDFASRYRNTHERLADPAAFRVDDALFREFTDFVKARKFEYTSRAEGQLAQVTDQLKKESYFDKLSPQITALADALKAQSASEITTYRDEVSLLLRREIVGRYYFQAGEHQSLLNEDPDVKAAISVLSDPQRYAELLKPAH